MKKKLSGAEHQAMMVGADWLVARAEGRSVEDGERMAPETFVQEW